MNTNLAIVSTTVSVTQYHKITKNVNFYYYSVILSLSSKGSDFYILR